MDPDANVREQNEIIRRMRAGQPFDHERLRELQNALRAWLQAGGFPPTVASI